MKMINMKTRLRADRPMTSIALRMPEDVVADLRRIAPLLGFSGCQPLMRTYIGQGLRSDLDRLENTPIARFVEALRRQGVPEDTIQRAMDELAA